MADKSTNNIELKVLVDKGSNKVIFIEPENDFVDVLFSFMTIPMGTIIRLARKHSDPVAIGCMNNLYASVENIDEQKFWIPICKDMLLRPRNAANPQCNLLKLKLDDAKPGRYCMCPYNKCISYDNNTSCSCPSGYYAMNERSLSLSPSQVGSVFVKGEIRFTVTDDLQVIPPIASTNYVFTKLGVMDVDATEELTVNIGTVEMFNLLMSSLVSKTPLTETLLKPKQEPKLNSSKVINQAIHIETQMFGDSTNDKEGTISVKLVVSKSKKMVCYAEAGEDFVSLLFSFLTLPLGFILKNMKDGSLRGCISHLYKTIQDLDGQYMISNHHNEMILDPKLVPGFCYKNSLLGIETSSYYYGNGTLTTDRSLFSSEPNQLKLIGNMDDSALGFLKGPAMFVVTDNLVVRPISRILELHVLKDLNVPVTDTEDQIVHVGKKEALHLLLASCLCDSVLTNTFVGDLREPKQEQ
ncbi:PREDICTED: uncharacterized protein LOC103320274 [Prunus mume]|uniref:Uncharacterized protein LOC103320274 n=1 Tax=Prunus mume TaxID=102107 RepID=A0ABM0N695_PRUMU|nr:PREDICTED: uncharacterized protein LOC103320274 [Prunus mume]